MENAFQYKDTTKTFPGFKLGPINLELKPGTVLGLIGPNGAGKTTLIQCLVGLLQKDSGEIRIFGSTNDPNHTDWKLDIGYVGDIPVFYERWTGRRNLAFLAQFYPDWSDEKAKTLAERFQLPLDKRAKDLSTGNRVKLSLISALAYSPRLLLLDEPTTGIDPVIRAEVLDVLFEELETGERAIFYTTHVLSEISRLADELAFIDEGHIWFRTAKEDLSERWRKITFQLAKKEIHIKSIVSHRQEGNDHQVISSEYQATFDHLRELQAENIRDSRMSIEEIAVQVLKGGKGAPSA